MARNDQKSPESCYKWTSTNVLPLDNHTSLKTRQTASILVMLTGTALRGMYTLQEMLMYSIIKRQES